MARPPDPRRIAALLRQIRATGGTWKTSMAVNFYRENGWGTDRSVARAALQRLADTGDLLPHDHGSCRGYMLNYAKNGNR